MNREIKFEYGFESVNGIIKKVYHLHEIPNIKDKCDLWNELPIKYIRQFTGLKDKNGKEIYEGDVLHSNSSTVTQRTVNPYHVVEWSNDGWVATGYNGAMKVRPRLSFKTDFEIIGNVFEHPELIK